MLPHPAAALAAALLTSFAPAAARAAVAVPFVEDFPENSAAWRDNAQFDLGWVATGGPDDSSYASAGFNYFGFESPFGGGPVIFRANDAQDASGDAFVGDWSAANVGHVTAWVRQATGEDLVFFVRLATSGGFPGAVIDDDEAVPSGVWTQIEVEIDPATCELEGGGSCADLLQAVGILQIGTLPPESLTTADTTFGHDIDQVELLAPEPAQAALLAVGALTLAAGRRRRGSAD